MPRLPRFLALAAAAVVVSHSPSSSAQPPRTLAINPALGGPRLIADRVQPPIAAVRPRLPVFGMTTFNTGWGDQIASITPGGVAWRLGLEPGDTLIRLNGAPLRHRGAWWAALEQAMAQGGCVRLAIHDARTGRIVFRETNFPVDGGLDPRFDDRRVEPRPQARSASRRVLPRIDYRFGL